MSVAFSTSWNVCSSWPVGGMTAERSNKLLSPKLLCMRGTTQTLSDENRCRGGQCRQEIGCRKPGSPYSITEGRVPELILQFLAVSQQVTWVINPAVGCHYFPPGLQLPSQPLRRLLPISLFGKQTHNGCEQFAQDCYPTANPGPILRLRPAR